MNKTTIRAALVQHRPELNPDLNPDHNRSGGSHLVIRSGWILFGVLLALVMGLYVTTLQEAVARGESIRRAQAAGGGLSAFGRADAAAARQAGVQTAALDRGAYPAGGRP